MKVYVVGSSCTWFTRNNTSFILDDTMLFDVPSGAYKFIINKIDFFSIKSVFISHFHSDHFGDLQVVVTRFMRECEKNGVKHKLKVYGPKGTLDQLIKYNKVIFAAEDEYDRKSLTKNVDFIEVGDGDTFEENGYNVKVFKMNHGKVYCQGYSFTDKEGKTVSFSGDTIPCEGLEKMLSFSNFAFIDAAAEKKCASHICIDEFMKLKEKFVNCILYPVHTSDKVQDFFEKNDLNHVFDGETLLL